MWGATFVPAAGVIRFADVKVARRYSVCKPTYTSFWNGKRVKEIIKPLAVAALRK